MKDERILTELALIERENGILKAEDVVTFAEDPKTALHGQFCWDDTEAASLWRLHQARNLIRVVVSLTEYSPDLQRVYVSLTTDQDNDGGGYRPLIKVLSDDTMREQLLADAINEMQVFKSKYHGLKELAKVFEEMDKIALRKLNRKIRRAELSATL